MTRFSFTLLGLSLISFAGCGDDVATDAGPADSGSDIQNVDASVTVDTGTGMDANPGVDADPMTDTGPEVDAGPMTDAGPPPDPDAGPPADAGPPPLPEPMNHRPDPIMCDDMRSMPDVTISPAGGPCTAHADCTDGDNGRCLAGRGGNFCTYDRCFADDDCTGPCICGAGDLAPNSCANGACQVDSDCGPLSWCSPTFGGCGDLGGVVAYECHTPEDECNDDTDCSDLGASAYCKFSSEASHWVCDNSQCAG